MPKLLTEVRDIRPGETDEHYFKELAKRADQRMREIERLQDTEHYKGAVGYAYKSAVYDIQAITNNPNAKRFDISLKKNADGSVNKTDYHQKLNAVKRFLEAPTSTKTGITQMYKKRADTINQKYGTSFTWKELANYWEKAGAEKVGRAFGSDVMLKAVDRLKREARPKDVKKANRQNRKVNDSEVVQEVAEQIKEAGLTFNDLI